MPISQAARSAEQAHEALRTLAHTTRSIDDPTQIYDMLGSISLGLASLEQALHQVAELHDKPNRTHPRVESDARKGRAAAFSVSWELHRAAMMLHQVGETINRAHQTEATIAYPPPAASLVPDGPSISRNGMSL